MEESKKVVVTVTAFFVLVALVVAVYFLFIRDKDSGTPEAEAPIVEETQPAEKEESEELEPVAAEPIELDLDDSDPAVRELVRNISSRPEWAEWLLTEDLIRKFVAAVDNIANGQSPRDQIGFFNPKARFLVMEKEGQLLMDPAGFVRYAPVADVFDSLDTPGSVTLYRRLTTPIQEAYRDLGYPEGNFHRALMRAFDELLKVPVVTGDVLLEEKLKSYEMADPELEKLSAAQKHLFRMGPRNIRKIQAKIREFQAELRKNET